MFTLFLYADTFIAILYWVTFMRDDLTISTPVNLRGSGADTTATAAAASSRNSWAEVDMAAGIS